MAKQKTVWYLLGYTFLTRVPYLWQNRIPFAFDHGRDSMAVLHLVKAGALKFIGPWTSIPGVFFGPGWYYLLAPAYFLSNGHPVAAAGLMLFLGLIQVWLAYKYLGIYGAIILATAPAWLTISKSASNSFPMTLISLLIIIVLKQIKNKKPTVKQMVWLGLLASLGFHFSSAFSIAYLLIIPLILWRKKAKLSVKKILMAGLAFLIPFIPQLLFEIKNNFLQAKALISYFVQKNPQPLHMGKVNYVFEALWHELQLAVLPEIYWPGGEAQSLSLYLGLGLLTAGLMLAWQRKKPLPKLGEILIWLIIPYLIFLVFHFNVWYVYGLLPMAAVVVAQILRSSPKIIRTIYIILLLLTPLFGLWRYQISGKQIDNSQAFLPVKLKAIDYIYSQAGERPFSSYHYLPEIYDYAYQYLYLWQGFKGRQLPVEFAYKPKEISYVLEKTDLLERLPTADEPAELIFMIVEKPENKHHYPIKQWLEAIDYKEIVGKKIISPELEVWQASKD